MAFSHGNIAQFSIDSTAGGSLTSISAYVSNVTVSGEREITDLNVIGGNAVSRLIAGAAVSISLEGYWDPTLDEIFEAAMSEATPATRSVSYWPAGNATGARVYTGEAYVASYEVETPGDDAASWSAELVVSGAWTQGVVS